MGEGIYKYGLGKRKYVHTLQDFADRVLRRGKPNGSYYVFGRGAEALKRELRRNSVKDISVGLAISDKTILKYVNHPKRAKGAVVSFKRFRIVERAVKRPQSVYIDTKRNRLVFVCATRYDKDKVLKVIIEPNQRIGKSRFHEVISIGVVNKVEMTHPQYKKIR